MFIKKWRIGAVAITAAALAWLAPKRAAAAEYNVVLPLSSQHVLLGGTFTAGGSTGWKNLMIRDTNGQTPSGVTPLRFNGEVRGAVKSFNNVYVWGDFTSVNGQARPGIAKIATNGTLQAWTPPISGSVKDVLSVGSGFAAAQHIAIVGDLTIQQNGNPTPTHLVKVTQTSGALADNFTVSTYGGGPPSNVQGVRHGNNALVFATKRFGKGTTNYTTSAASYDLGSGARTNVSFASTSYVIELDLSGSALYMVGTVSKSMKSHVKAFDLGSNNQLLWDRPIQTANVTATNAFRPRGVKKVGTKVWIWGRSGFVGSATPFSLTSVNASDGEQNGWISNWGGNKCLPVQQINFIRFNGSKAFMATESDVRRCHSSTWVRTPTFFDGSAF